MKDLGLWQFDVPEEYGGGGLSALAPASCGRSYRAPSRCPPATARSPDRRCARSFTNVRREMKERYLFPVLRGEKRACFAQTEPDAGSDPGSMRTTAVRDGDHYVINGAKRFISGANIADFMQLMAATDRSKGSRGGISCFLVDMETPGVSASAARSRP